MKVHDLQPAAGSNKAPAARRPRHRRQGRQDRRPWHQGPGGPRHRSRPRSKAARCRCTCGSRSSRASTTRSASSTRPSTSTRSRTAASTEVTPETLHAKGLVAKGALVKVLGRGELTRAVTVQGPRLLEVGRSSHHGAGGTVERLPLPWGEGRPPAKGNQFTNR